MQTPLSAGSLSPLLRVALPIHKGNVCPASKLLKQRTFPTSVDSLVAFSSKYTKVEYFGVTYSGPLHKTTWVQILAPSFISCVTMSKSPKFSVKWG